MMKKLTALLLTLLTLTLSLALAEDVAVRDAGLDLLGSSVHYPQVTGLPDENVQSAVNAAIMAGGKIEARLSRMAMLLSSPVKLQVTYAYHMTENIFSCAFLAEGAVETTRSTQEWTAVTIDLATGETLSLDDLFRDAAEARALIEGYLQEKVAPELSAHLEADALVPLPETFSVDGEGLTLYYPIDRFRTLSDRAGTVRLWWYEIDHLLKDAPAALADTKEEIAALVQEGGLPGLPVKIGEALPDLIHRYGLLTDPDIYEGGRMIALENDLFRQTWILTDALTEDFDHSVMQSIRADRGQVGNLILGETTVNAWREMLGAPDTTLTVDAARAESWRIQPGVSDYYTLGAYRLRLHADETGVLRSIFLSAN